MPLVKSSQHGATYKWGFAAADAPSISNFSARGADLTYEPEVKSMATDGEGHVDSVTVSKPTNRKISAKFTGYVAESFDPLSLPEGFTFEGRYHLVGPVSTPRRKGDYWEVTIDTESFAGVSS